VTETDAPTIPFDSTSCGDLLSLEVVRQDQRAHRIATGYRAGRR
jgi:hypothetical protein